MAEPHRMSLFMDYEIDTIIRALTELQAELETNARDFNCSISDDLTPQEVGQIIARLGALPVYQSSDADIDLVLPESVWTDKEGDRSYLHARVVIGDAEHDLQAFQLQGRSLKRQMDRDSTWEKIQDFMWIQNGASRVEHLPMVKIGDSDYHLTMTPSRHSAPVLFARSRQPLLHPRSSPLQERRRKPPHD